MAGGHCATSADFLSSPEHVSLQDCSTSVVMS